MKEDIFFAQNIFRAYQHAPDAVIASLKGNLGRWQGDERAVALLVFDHHGDLASKRALKKLTSKRVRGLTALAKSLLKKADES